MMNKRALGKIKSFGMTNQMIQEDISRIGHAFNIDFGHLSSSNEAADQIYYPQIDASIRNEAAEMAKYYEIFYSLEKSIRTFVSDNIAAAEGISDWWQSNRVPLQIKNDVQQRVQKEIDFGVTLRSKDEIEYTTFGELSDIITFNWDIFGGTIFQSKKALQKVMSNLNTLRNPIAHCALLADDEKVRLQLSVRDWFRLLG